MSKLDEIAPVRWERAGGWVVTTDPALIDPQVVCDYLAAGDQSPEIPLETVRRMIAGSVNFGLFKGEPGGGQPGGAPMVGYARAVTDFATFAYIGDVFVLDGYRGEGVGDWLLDCVEGHPEMQNMRRWTLMCGPRPLEWYKRRGFVEPERPGFALHKTDREIYRRAARSKGV